MFLELWRMVKGIIQIANIFRSRYWNKFSFKSAHKRISVSGWVCLVSRGYTGGMGVKINHWPLFCSFFSLRDSGCLSFFSKDAVGMETTHHTPDMLAVFQRHLLMTSHLPVVIGSRSWLNEDSELRVGAILPVLARKKNGGCGWEMTAVSLRDWISHERPLADWLVSMPRVWSSHAKALLFT